MKEIHIVLKEIRKKKGYSRKKIAELMGISVSAYGHWETGVRQPSIQDLIKLADFYEISMDYIVGRYS